MENKIQVRLQQLRKNMKRNSVDVLYILLSDFHGSEYVGEYFQCLKFFSGFTGSAGTLLILQEEAGLWTDGRYFIQAQQQLDNTGITLYKMQEKGVPTVHEFLQDKIGSGQTVSVDTRTISFGEFEKLSHVLQQKGANLRTDLDLAGKTWEELEKRPALLGQPVWQMADRCTGKSSWEKLQQIRAQMEKQKADILLISSLDDIAWLLNLRGNDIPYVPVFLSYLLMDQEQVKLFAMQTSFSKELVQRLESDGIFLFPYESIYEELSKLEINLHVWFDPNDANAALIEKIPSCCHIIKKDLPTMYQKAIKNHVEIENERTAHLYDGIAFCKFLFWLKKQIPETLTEISAAEHLEKFRRQQKTYLEPSFAPISAYAQHGAIVHYSATEDTNDVLHGEGFLLMDTGAHYDEGTTDITRTLVMGTLTQKQKQHYTAVLRGNLNLGKAVFRRGCCGVHLDILARSPLWELGLDYLHGTGHGVGYVLNVHEEPNNIRMNLHVRHSATQLQEGMITSNEPGVYIEGEYGIRLENLILCKQADTTEFGEFLEFETLTLVPFETAAILPEMMTKQEIDVLNQYHKTVYQKISPHLTAEEAAWLLEATAPIE